MESNASSSAVGNGREQRLLTRIGVIVALFTCLLKILSYLNVGSHDIQRWYQPYRPALNASFYGLLGFLAALFSLRFIPGLRPKEAKKSCGIEVFKGWADAHPIISSAKKSVVIVDTFLVNEVGQIQACVQEAASNLQDGSILTVSVYMADPERIFGAQRIREKEHLGTEGDNETNRTIRLNEFKKTLHSEISSDDRDRHKEKFSESVREIGSHVCSLQKVYAAIYMYPTMPTIRIFLIDDVDFIFGWFPLDRSNPGYPCCHLKDSELDGADKELAKELRQQVKIIHAISDKVDLAAWLSNSHNASKTNDATTLQQ